MGVQVKQLFGLLGMTYDDAARFLGLSKSTVEKRIQRKSGWSIAEITMIVSKIEEDTGIVIDMKKIKE